MKTKRQFMASWFNGNSFAGMTFKNAGNFYPEGSVEKAYHFAKKVLDITGFLHLTDRLIVMRAETHGNDVIHIFKMPQVLSYYSQYFCDGIIFNGKGAAIFFPGGCAAIAFRDKKADISGMLHGGWKPIAQGIIKNFLRKWESAGGSPETTQIEFLPSICGNCLTFDTIYFEEVSAALKLYEPNMFIHKINGKYGLDLSKLIEVSLNELGYGTNNNASCVCCSGNHWCYRCDDKNGKKHRNAAFIITS